MGADLMGDRFLGFADEEAADVEKDGVGSKLLFEVAGGEWLDSLAEALDAWGNGGYDAGAEFVDTARRQFGSRLRNRNRWCPRGAANQPREVDRPQGVVGV